MRKILETSHQNVNEYQKNQWLEHIAQNRHSTGQQEVESQRRFPTLFNGSTSRFKYEELIEDCMGLTVLEETKREDQH